MRFARAICCLVLPGIAWTQTPRFDAADVHAGTTDFSHGGFLPNGRVDLRGWTLLDLIAFAYGVERDAVSGGPNWLDDDRWDVRAKRPAPSDANTDRQMVQTLLAERFHLAAHIEEKSTAVFALTVAKKSSALVSSDASGGECEPSTADGVMTLRCRGVSMAKLTSEIRRFGGNYLNRTVVDQTGLAGAYDFALHWTRPGVEPTESIVQAIENQLGLKLRPTTAMLPALSIDRVDRIPTPNPPETDKLLPRYTEFEVAVLKPSRPGETKRFRTLPGGRVEAEAVPLKTLLLYAFETGERWVVNLQKWMEADLYDLSAKAPATDADNQSVRDMLKSLLAARFQLKTHYEDRPEPVYVLTAPKRATRLAPADAAAPSNCKSRMGAGGETTFACRNTTMAQFAERLGESAGAWFDQPVIDETGLPGAYDFSIFWASKARYLAPPAADDANTPDPPGGVTAFHAVEQLLGDRVESQRRPRRVLVIDSIERRPSDN